MNTRMRFGALQQKLIEEVSKTHISVAILYYILEVLGIGWFGVTIYQNLILEGRILSNLYTNWSDFVAPLLIWSLGAFMNGLHMHNNLQRSLPTKITTSSINRGFSISRISEGVLLYLYGLILGLLGDNEFINFSESLYNYWVITLIPLVVVCIVKLGQLILFIWNNSSYYAPRYSFVERDMVISFAVMLLIETVLLGVITGILLGVYRPSLGIFESDFRLKLSYISILVYLLALVKISQLIVSIIGMRKDPELPTINLLL